MVFDTVPGEGGFVSTVSLPNLDTRTYTGQPCDKKQEAEHSAAAAACLALGVAPAAPPAPAASVKLKPTKGQSHNLVKLEGAQINEALQQEGSGVYFKEWRESRVEALPPGTVVSDEELTSLDLWYGQICLVCLCVCAKQSWKTHAMGQKHRKNFECSPVRKRPDCVRPPTAPSQMLLGPERFVAAAGWSGQMPDGSGYPPILTVGEMDYSFSLAVASLRPAGSPLVATSYLEEHDPSEPEVYPADDGQRASYVRRSLPGMKGALQRNLSALEALSCEVRHGVDAMDLEGTLRPKGIAGGFKYIVFPFPRATLQRACDPRNSRLLRNFFLSALNHSFMMEGGIVQMLMLQTQYEEWDVACMAAEAGFHLMSRAALPADFYQAREMSGKPWQPQGAELISFEYTG